MRQQDKVKRFEASIAPHLNAAYNLARWLTKNDNDAEDVVQEASIRAFQFFEGFRGGDGRAWLLRIVRNTSYTWLQRNRANEVSMHFDEELEQTPSGAPSPEALLLQEVDSRLLRQAIEGLPTEFRETLILRDLEDLSYKEIADIVEIPIGTVMSRLARARKRLAQCLAPQERTVSDL